MVTSVLLYNCSSWAVPEDVFAKVDVQQRKHLRQVLRIYWPNTISNQALYDRCKTVPLTRRIEVSRSRMLGHILRSGKKTPAFLSFKFACLGCMDMKGRLGRPRTNLFDLVIRDLKDRSMFIDNSERNFDYIVHKASNREFWRSLE